MNSAENEKQASLPVIAITMGDPAGIGPEVIAKALRRCQSNQLTIRTT